MTSTHHHHHHTTVGAPGAPDLFSTDAGDDSAPIEQHASQAYLGYAVSTVGFELEQVRQYIREQDAADGSAGQF